MICKVVVLFSIGIQFDMLTRRYDKVLHESELLYCNET